MRKIYLFLVSALLLSAANASAQCSMSGRYNSYVFSGYTLTQVQYSSTSTSDSMDIYQPTGDTYTNRPVILLAHGGSFIGGSRRLDAGSNTDPAVDTLCLHFVKRGYVTVSIDYRLATSPLQMVTSAASAADVVAKAISDGKSAIRYLVQHRTTYGIDTNNIFVGGNSAGAVMFMHIGYLDSVGECTPLMYTALMNNGGFEGNSGNTQSYPTTKPKGIINFAGGLASVGLVSTGNIPSVNCQGDADATVPYTCAKALSGNCPDTLCGLGSLKPQYVLKGINHWDTVFVGAGHVPWDSDNGMMNSVDSLTNQFLYSLVCSTVNSVNNVPTISDVTIFPNPATDLLNIRSSDFVSAVSMYDQMGRIVYEANNINRGSYQINTANMPKGIYFVKIRFNNESNAPMVRQVAVQ